ncbi:MAG: hypothetical protein JWN74_1610 [Acidobacteriaceae bacterium]|nr:hypothetical protein [Acidobacteriaceae bacterium]
MKIHNLTIAALILFILSGVLYWSGHHKPAEDSAKISADSPPPILKLDVNSITQLAVKKKDAEPVLLTKSSSGDWQITGPKTLRADQSAVTGIASTLSSLNSERVIEDKASDLQTFGLDQPPLEVDLTQKDNKTQKLMLGGDTPAGGAIYAMLAGDPRLFTIASYTKTSLDKTLNDLRDKRLLPVNADKISRIELVRKNGSIEFARNKNKDDWQILKPTPMRADGTQVGDLVRDLTNAKMDISSSDAKDAASEFAHATPVATAKVTDESGTQELHVRANKSKDSYYAKSSAVDGAFKIDSGLGKTLAKGLEDFRNKKLFDFGYNDPNKIELRNGAKAFFLTRGTAGSEDWWSNGKKMDATNVESVISDLRDLTASSFPATGFSNPAIEAIVTSDDGKRTERILIAKSGDHYIAQRDNEPALYQLDSSAVDPLLKAADELRPAAIQAAQKKP